MMISDGKMFYYNFETDEITKKKTSTGGESVWKRDEDLSGGESKCDSSSDEELDADGEKELSVNSARVVSASGEVEYYSIATEFDQTAQDESNWAQLCY